jgi:chromosome segregation ATPase
LHIFILVTKDINRLRDGLTRSNADINSLKKEVELAQLERDELTSLCEKLEQELDGAKESVTNFRDQVDAAMGSEKMIATLTDKNLDLEDKIKYYYLLSVRSSKLK